MTDYRDRALRLTIANPKLCEEIASIVARQRKAAARASVRVGMTPRMQELYSFIRDFSNANNGVCPSFDEMTEAVGLASKSGVHRMICALEERGMITRLQGRARAIVVNESELIRSVN